MLYNCISFFFINGRPNLVCPDSGLCMTFLKALKQLSVYGQQSFKLFIDRSTNVSQQTKVNFNHFTQTGWRQQSVFFMMPEYTADFFFCFENIFCFAGRSLSLGLCGRPYWPPWHKKMHIWQGKFCISLVEEFGAALRPVQTQLTTVLNTEKLELDITSLMTWSRVESHAEIMTRWHVVWFPSGGAEGNFLEVLQDFCEEEEVCGECQSWVRRCGRGLLQVLRSTARSHSTSD